MAAISLTSSHYRPFGKRAALLLVPAVLMAVALLIVPMSTIVVSAFSQGNASTAHFSVGYYVDILTDEFYWEVLLRTIRISLLTTVVALVISYPAALYLFLVESRWHTLFLAVALSPLFVSVIVRTYGWIIILSPNGVLNALLPGGLPFRLLRTESAVVIGLVHIYIPFMLLSLNAALVKLDKRLLSAAASLGASKLSTLRDIVVPLSMPGIIAGATIVFTISMTAFSTPILLGGSQNKTMPYLIFQQVMLTSNWHMGSALALFLMAFTLAIVFLIRRVTRLVVPFGAS